MATTNSFNDPAEVSGAFDCQYELVGVLVHSGTVRYNG